MLIVGVTLLYYMTIYERPVKSLLNYRQFNNFFYISGHLHKCSQLQGRTQTKIFGGTCNTVLMQHCGETAWQDLKWDLRHNIDATLSLNYLTGSKMGLATQY